MLPKEVQENIKVQVMRDYSTFEPEVYIEVITRAGKSIYFKEGLDVFPSKMLLSRINLVY